MKSTRPTVLVLALERLDRDIRIQKQIRTLQRGFDVTLAALSRAPGSGYDFVQLEQRKWSGCIFWVSAKIQATGYAPFSHLRMRLAFYVSSIAKLDRQDLIVCNNVESLPIGLYLKRKWGCRLLADLHEYAAAGHRHAAKRDRAIRLCRDCFPHIDQALTVSHGLEKLYKDDFSLDCKVVPNVPYRHPGATLAMLRGSTAISNGLSRNLRSRSRSIGASGAGSPLGELVVLNAHAGAT